MSQPTLPTPGLARTLRTVGAAMFGVRGRKRHEEDAVALSPLLVIVAALLFMAIFVGVLLTLANIAVAN
jgi:hypothetical protein